MRTTEPVTIHRGDYRPYEWRVPQTRLVFDLSPEQTRVSATLTLERIADSDGSLMLDGVGLVLESLRVDGVEPDPASWTLTDTHLTLVGLPAQCELQTTAVINPESNTSLEGLYRSSGTYCTQCEAEGFRKITWFPDRPDVLSVFDVEINAPLVHAPVLLSNGNLIDFQSLEKGRHQARWHDPFPKPGYLFALVAGDLHEVADTFVTASGKEVALSIYVEAHNLARCDFAIAALKRAMLWDEQAYGLEYDLDRYMIVAVDDFNMGAMENKGLNVFNSKFVLADPETATDTDFLWVEAVIAHEYFHNWTGNRVTCRDWFQLSLKEGLTVFRDQSFTADLHAATVKRIDDVRRLRQSQFVEDAGPLAHPIRPDSYIEINNFYTTTIYEKGAEVIRMLHTLIGADAWRRGMDLYIAQHDGTAATCEDFVRAMEQASERDLAQFRYWYSYAGTPVVKCSEQWDATQGRLSLTLSQQCPDTPGQSDKMPMHVPVSIGLIGSDGQDLEGGKVGRVLELTQAEQQFEFVGLAERPVVSVLRGFSAPVRVERDLDVATLGFLATHDSDGFNRWDALQQLTHRAIDARLRDQSNAVGEAEQQLSSVIASLLAQAIADKAPSESANTLLAAEMLSLPSVSLLAEERAVIDVLAVSQARGEVLRSLALTHGDALRHVVLAAISQAQTGIDDPAADEFGFGGQATAVRALAGAALELLESAEESTWVPLATEYYRVASTMTDRVSALRGLCHAQAPERDECLADFEARFHDNALVMDKWFALQAMSRRDDTLDHLERLSQRADFDIANPNRLRSLVASFATGNPTGFHAEDGQGHAWLADWVIRVDDINPLIAARLVAPLARWHRREAGAAQSMKAQLTRILDSGSRSPDVYELASKSLA
jgi:aminopeptidase N